MIDVIKQDYIRTARAKGLKERKVLFTHALRNALLPAITLVGFELPALFGGSLIIEKIFNWPGIGQLYMQSFALAGLSAADGLHDVYRDIDRHRHAGLGYFVPCRRPACRALREVQ